MTQNTVYNYVYATQLRIKVSNQQYCPFKLFCPASNAFDIGSCASSLVRPHANHDLSSHTGSGRFQQEDGNDIFKTADSNGQI